MRDLYLLKGSGFICNDRVTTKYLWKVSMAFTRPRYKLFRHIFYWILRQLSKSFNSDCYLQNSHEKKVFDADINDFITLWEDYQKPCWFKLAKVSGICSILTKKQTRYYFPRPSDQKSMKSILTIQSGLRG